MLQFLFEQYGYYPTNFIDNTFFVDSWMFKLIEIDETETYIDKIDEYISVVREKIDRYSIFLIKTRFNKKISIYDGKRYVLMSSLVKELSFADLNRFHYVMMEPDKTLDLNNLLVIWKERTDLIENQYVNSLRIDSIHYNSNIEVSMFALGLAQNSSQYLSEIINDFGQYLENLTLTHKRLVDLQSFEFYNPFNLIVDHPIKDLCELYKNDFLSFEEMEQKFEIYNLDSKLASVFVARMLYPNKIFDLLEKNYYDKDVSFTISVSIEKEIMKIKKIYLYFKQKYDIKPIEWLEY